MSGIKVDDLENLNEDELQAVANLINKFSKRKKTPSQKPKRVDKKDTELIIKKQTGRQNRRKRILVDENDSIEKSTRGKGRTAPTKEYNKRNKRGGRNSKQRGKGKNKKMARTESVQLTGANNFLQMKERRGNKEDSKIDKSLWKNRKPSERSKEDYEEQEVQCKVCDLWFDVHPSLVLMDEETRECNYTCDGCVRR